MPNLIRKTIVPDFLDYLDSEGSRDYEPKIQSFEKKNAWKYLSSHAISESSIDTQRRASVLHDYFKNLIDEGKYTKENPFPESIPITDTLESFWNIVEKFYGEFLL